MDQDHRRALETLFARTSEPGAQARTVIGADEIARWPSDALQVLVEAGILKAWRPAATIICHGCEERCLRQVFILPTEAAEPERTGWTCDLFSDKGPFVCTTDALQRWSMSRNALAKFIGRLLGLEIKSSDREARRVRYDPIRIGCELRSLSVEFADSAVVLIGSSRIPLLDLLEWTEAGIAVDREALQVCINSSGANKSSNKSYQPSVAVRDDKKLSTEVRNRSLQREVDRLAKEHPRLSKEQLAAKAASSTVGKGMTASRIARVTRKPKKTRRKNFA